MDNNGKRIVSVSYLDSDISKNKVQEDLEKTGKVELLIGPVGKDDIDSLFETIRDVCPTRNYFGIKHTVIEGKPYLNVVYSKEILDDEVKKQVVQLEEEEEPVLNYDTNDFGGK